ncbi:MAG: methylmalonyl-CoA mutase family protein [Geminicoccaceae bacterium]
MTLSKNARARAVQLPAWNEALGLPRPFDQQWSLRMQQILAFETDLLEYEDIFDGSHVIAARAESLKDEARAELARIDEMGGSSAVESGYMKARLVESNTKRVGDIAGGRQKVIGVNCYTDSAPSLPDHRRCLPRRRCPRRTGPDRALQAFREQRDGAAVDGALAELRRVASEGAISWNRRSSARVRG